MSDCNPKRIASKRAMLRGLNGEFKCRLAGIDKSLHPLVRAHTATRLYGEFRIVASALAAMPARHFHRTRPKLDWRQCKGRPYLKVVKQ